MDKHCHVSLCFNTISCRIDIKRKPYYNATMVFFILYFLMVFSIFSANQNSLQDDGIPPACSYHYPSGLCSLAAVHRFLDAEDDARAKLPSPCAACWLFFTLGPDGLSEARKRLPETPWLRAMHSLHKTICTPDRPPLLNTIVHIFKLLDGTNDEWMRFCDTQKGCILPIAPINDLLSHCGTFGPVDSLLKNTPGALSQ